VGLFITLFRFFLTAKCCSHARFHIALIYSGLLAHPASHVILTHPAVQALGIEANPALSPLAAKATGAVVLGVLFGIRVWRVHWVGNQSGIKPKMKTP
jgi:hypothetical protein